MQTHIYDDIDQLITAAAADMIQKTAQEAMAERGQFNFVLSGGSSPKKLYKLLSSEAYKNTIDWKHTYFFFGDERYVPENDSQRNSTMVKKTLFDPLNTPASHIFLVDTKGSPTQAAQIYTNDIASHFHHQSVHFDLVLLGLGDDGHTASLFPNTSVLAETEAVVKSVFVEKLKMHRITMTAPLMNQSRNVAFLVYGKNKAEAVFQVLQNAEATPQQYPAKLILPKEGKIHWYLDTKASALLKPEIK